MSTSQTKTTIAAALLLSGICLFTTACLRVQSKPNDAAVPEAPVTEAVLSAPQEQDEKTGEDANTFGGIVRFDRTVHNFGDILTTQGPVKAEFKAVNVGKEALVIHNVVTSCGCTDVEWTRKPIRPGESGTISGTYKNEDGPIPFDKTLTVYVSGLKKPVVLRLRGEAHEKKLPLDEQYPVHFGSLGLKSLQTACGTLTQGKTKGGELLVANIGKKPLKVGFGDVSENLSLSVAPNPIPAGETAVLTYSIRTDREHWGRNSYYARPLPDGKPLKAVLTKPESQSAPAGADYLLSEPDPNVGSGKELICFQATTREDFLSWSKTQIDDAPNPIADQSTFAFGKVRTGATLSGSFTITNQGKIPFKVYKIDSETARLSVSSFSELSAGSKGVLSFTFSTEGLEKGEHIVQLALTTNSPWRPIMNLFVTCLVE